MIEDLHTQKFLEKQNNEREKWTSENIYVPRPWRKKRELQEQPQVSAVSVVSTLSQPTFPKRLNLPVVTVSGAGSPCSLSKG